MIRLDSISRLAFPALRSIVPIALCAAVACSAKASVTHGAGNACDRGLVTEDDVTGILREPIVRVQSLASDGDPQSCGFETAGFASITISLRPGLGNTTVATWASGRMPTPAETLSGVGDRAVWSAELKEVIATKNDVLCDIGVGGPPGGSVASDIVKRRLGELCNKIFEKP